MKPNQLMLIILVAPLSFLPLKSVAGLKWAEVGVNGLTCSACTRSVEMSLRRLDFVDRVVMSLETTEGKIYFKNGSTVDLKKIARAVVDAGFSVRFLRVAFNFDDVPVGPDGSFTYQDQTYQWLQFKDGLAKDDAVLKLVDDGFLPARESNHWKKKLGISNQSTGQKTLHVVQEL